MLNKEKIKKEIMQDFDKKNNYQKIINKVERKPNNYLTYALIPMILIIVVSIVLLNINHNNQIKIFKEENVNIKNINTTSNNDYTGLNTNFSSHIIVNELKDYKMKDNNSKNYINNINIPYFDILKDIKIPSDFDVIADGKGVSITKNDNDKAYGKINNYELWYKNAKNNRKIVIALSNNSIPYREYKIDQSNSNKTIINGIEVMIYKYKNIYVSIFSYQGYNFDIETCDIIEEEYTRLLYSIIK